MADIDLSGVGKTFAGTPALQDITTRFDDGEFIALLGPSGCGKTTMMRMLAGFEAPTEGKIFLAGQDIAPVPPNQRAVNMMFQSYALFPHLSIWENIAFGLKREGMPRAEIAARVEEMLRLTRLEKFARRKPHQISGGQRQRVALARSLAKAPKLLLLDEPLGALDRKLREETQFELMDIQEKTGTTFVIVTHDQEEAMTVASRVAVMDNGKVIQVATPADIYEAPNSSYVADFIGDVNLIQGQATATGEDTYALHWREGAAPLTIKSPNAISDGQTAHLAIRPEKVTISADKPEGADNVVQGKVLDIAYLGNLSTYHVELPTGDVIKAQTANTRRISRRAYTWEDTVWLSWTATGGVLLAD